MTLSAPLQISSAAIVESITELVGRTPMIRLNRVSGSLAKPLLAKLEAFNPGGSVKDRIGLAMIEDAEARGKIAPGKNTLVEPTSGNTGVGLAFVAAAKGYRLVLTMPDSMSIERRTILQALGAELHLTPGAQGMHGAMSAAKELAATLPGGILMGQFDNPANPEIHRRTTAHEIWEATQGEIDIFVAGVGTGGTITGVGEVLKSKKPGLQVIAVEPANSPVLSGGEPGAHMIQGIGPGFVPSILNTAIYDEIIQIRNTEAIEAAQDLAKQEGILAGISSGAALHAALQVAERPENEDKQVVTLLPDTGERYLSTSLFADLD